jgi:hypothetical protein
MFPIIQQEIVEFTEFNLVEETENTILLLTNCFYLYRLTSCDKSLY